jgi:O-antigen chain-terminating methyltransferase
MIEHCKAKNLEVVQDDACHYLSGLDDNSLRGVISCHVIEHFTPAELLTFLRLCVQKLAPAGRMVLETPNPTSFFSLSMFYRDFTHQQPIHPDMLKLALEQLGLENVQIMKMSPVPHELALDTADDPIMKENIKKLNDMIYGHLDFAALAVKPQETD